MKTSTFCLTEGQIKQLRQIAKETGLGYSEVVRRAIDQYIDWYKEDIKYLKTKGLILIKNKESREKKKGEDK